jgi:serine/threonine-protein kinase MRCK
MGPDIQKQRLLDLPTTVDTAEQQSSTLPPKNQRVQAIRQPPPVAPRTPPRPTNVHTKRPVIPARYPSSLPRSPSPLDSHSSVSSLHETLKSSSDRKSGSRQSITSNNSSSSPPSPINSHAERLSSSYDS